MLGLERSYHQTIVNICDLCINVTIYSKRVEDCYCLRVCDSFGVNLFNMRGRNTGGYQLFCMYTNWSTCVVTIGVGGILIVGVPIVQRVWTKHWRRSRTQLCV